ncbi:MAG: cache domain-containing protein [Desulfuromonadaceae bacterium]|nr:cache domain-containing protein [Desulfuromonadaceae bacterium]
MRILGMLSGVLFLIIVAAVSVRAGEPRDEAVSLVQGAVKYYKANGLEKAIDEVSNPKGMFNKGELYVFVYDANATMMAHPNPKLIGQNMIDLPDAAGKKFRKEIVDIAAKDGKGWTDYRYKNPKTSEVESKTTYFEKVDDLIFCCGIYKK